MTQAEPVSTIPVGGGMLILILVIAWTMVKRLRSFVRKRIGQRNFTGATYQELANPSFQNCTSCAMMATLQVVVPVYSHRVAFGPDVL
jgi:hypothetical protein